MTARPNFTVSGTKAEGDVPTVQADLSVAWAAASGGSSSLVDSWLGSSLAAQIVDPVSGNAVWNYPADALVGSDLSLSADGTTITFVTAGQYVVSVHVLANGSSPANLTVSPLVTSSPTNYYNVAPTAFLIHAIDTFTTDQVTYPPTKMGAGDTLTVDFSSSGDPFTAFTDTSIWVTKSA